MMTEWPPYDLLRHRAATTPNRQAIIETRDDTSIDWRTLDDHVGGLATGFTDSITPGDRVGIAVETKQAFKMGFWAINRLGGSTVPLNGNRPPEQLGNRIRRANCVAVLCDATTEDQVTTASDRPIYSFDPSEYDAVTTLDPASGTTSPVERRPDAEQLVMYTSGTTGQPKGVRITGTNLLSSAIGSAIRLGITPSDRWLHCLPTYHMGGFAPIIRTTLYGTPLVLQHEFDTTTTQRVIDAYDITGVSLVPTMLRRLLDDNWTPPQSLRTVLLGGAPAGQPLIERALDANVPVHPTYGLTETASQVTTATPDSVATAPDTVGPPLLVTDVTIVDEDGHICPPGDIGEIVVDGPTVAPAYLDREATTNAYSDRGLATGDLGHQDEQGRLWIHGRLDDRIVTGGENVAPAAVVTVLRKHEGIADAAVVGLDDPEWGEQVAALIVPIPDTDLDPDTIREHCKRELAGYECPRTIAFTDTLPRTDSGTIDRDAVRTQLNEATQDEGV